MLYKWGIILIVQVEWASCPLSIFSRFLYTSRFCQSPINPDSRFPIPDSRFPSLNTKPQLGATLCSKLLAGVSQKESYLSKKSYKGKRSVAW
ncbi:hypothetical protein [Moorena sp. SIO3H5]|uniref:hypothetical protein n=1 Tax=Moorena sp. SIO3H5 TaxID=2607834 RepID=UPI0013BC5E58|nr:hypothetical protein [Moorena sp. SIO3H5]NEO74195.1 hypothetical protein [Moorena sp. SIO3H5]